MIVGSTVVRIPLAIRPSPTRFGVAAWPGLLPVTLTERYLPSCEAVGVYVGLVALVIAVVPRYQR